MTDKQVSELIEKEKTRQLDGLELIPSENYASQDVLGALGSVFTNKYSEGYPGKRYYGGQDNTDPLEELAINRAKRIFGSDHANVQPHSGAQANEAAYYSWMNPGDKVLSMALDQGGHLTHGHPTTVLAKIFQFVHYGIKDYETGEVDYDGMRNIALEHRPKMIMAGFSSYPRELDYSKFKEIADEVGAVLIADMSHLAGLIAGGVLKNPLDFGFHIMTTTTHKTMRGPRGGLILSKGEVSNPLKKPEKTILNIPTLIDRTVFPGVQGGPHMNTIAAKAVCFGEALDPDFKNYAKQVIDNSKALASELMNQGCKLITNGTDNHLMVIDTVKSFGIDGAAVEEVLDSVGLTVNKNAIPNDPNPPFRPSGVRLGTPAITTRGLKTQDMSILAGWITKSIASRNDMSKLSNIKNQIKELAKSYPLPGI